MKHQEIFGILTLFVVFLIASLIVTFAVLGVAPTHPGSEQHTEVLKFLVPSMDSDLRFLNEQELNHMQDVKLLVNLLLIVFIVGLFILYKKSFDLRERFAGYGLLLVIAFFAGVSLKGFTGAWTRLHHMLFPQGGWYFPVESTIIQLYPESYFFHAALIFTGFVLISAGLLIGNFKLPWNRK